MDDTLTLMPRRASVQAVQPSLIRSSASGGDPGALRMPIGAPTSSVFSSFSGTCVASTSAPNSSWAEVVLMSGRSTGSSPSGVSMIR